MSHLLNSSACGPREAYNQSGFYVWKNLIPVVQIDEILSTIKHEVIPSKRFFVRQDSGRWEVNKINQYGYLQNPLGDPHDLSREFKFGAHLRDLFCGNEVHSALESLTGYPKFRFIQSMFYDCNPSSPAHIDSLYLDSIPNGSLTGVWIALEDIHVDAGRFFVFPKTNHVNFDIPSVDPNSLFVEKIVDYAREHSDDLFAPSLKKGDAIFWNSATVHGSLATTNPAYSRKSLTAHFVPKQFKLGNIYKEFDESQMTFSEHNGVEMRIGTHKCPYPQADTFEQLQQALQNYIDENSKVLVRHEEIFAVLEAEIKRLRLEVTKDQS